MLQEQTPQVVQEHSLAEYFHRQFNECAGSTHAAPQEDTCWYLGCLLERFACSDACFSYERGEQILRPLALLYGDAFEAANEAQRCLLLQRLGDQALFLAALFPGHFTRRGIRSDYLIGMGGGAYGYLADNARRGRHIFAELAGAFADMIDLVAEVCSAAEPQDNSGVLAMHQRWLDSGDPLIGRQLARMGVSLLAGTSLH
ncbi:MAG: hypothetical protein V2I82_12270 [Halieaceae bacterium]|jgi:hypothetical protein|nr:hypothetical protein [Halieaceae bacterium]